MSQLAGKAASAIEQAFQLYQNEFKKTTRRARSCFERRDWHAQLQNSADRLDIYNRIVLVIVAEIRNILQDRVMDKQIWAEMKREYSAMIKSRSDVELAETFFNSITRRIFTTVGVDPSIEYVSSDFNGFSNGNLPLSSGQTVGDSPIYQTYNHAISLEDLVCHVIEDTGLNVEYCNLEDDSRLAAFRIECRLRDEWGSSDIDSAEFLLQPFFRSKGAYIIGRVRRGSRSNPVVLCLRHDETGVSIDAVLLTENDVSILFSFTRSYFLVEVEQTRELIAFLKVLMPLKPVAELYISIGYNKHGKTELFRDLLRHLNQSSDRFQFTPGQRGMVMIVFSLPSYDMVFKVIRDRFPEPKRTTRQAVMGRYQLVFKHDRAGRLVDAQEFEHLSFEKSRFDPQLLEELIQEAPSVVSLDGDRVDIRHVYTERRMTPLDVFIREKDDTSSREAIIDYGYAIKDLAATNIFPGDILLKNFGVTRHGRVVFYDYDELCLLSECKFRRIPPARSFSDDFESEPWFYVGDDDIFPQEFETFLGLQGDLRDSFTQVHSDLFDADFWKTMQQHHQQGVVVDIYPYKQASRLHQPPTSDGAYQPCPG